MQIHFSYEFEPIVRTSQCDNMDLSGMETRNDIIASCETHFADLATSMR